MSDRYFREEEREIRQIYKERRVSYFLNEHHAFYVSEGIVFEDYS